MRLCLRPFVSAAIVASLAVGSATVLVRAAGLTAKFDAEVRRLRSEWRTEQEAAGLPERTRRKELYTQYSTPEITLCKAATVVPGASTPVSISGKFPAKTAFVMENDQVTLDAGTSTTSTYRAVATAAPDAVPSYGRLYVYAPVSGAYNRCGAVLVAAMPSFELTAAKTGWIVKLAPTAKAYTITSSGASLPYRADYFKPGETTPFESASGELSLSINDTPRSNYTLSMTAGEIGMLMQELQSVQQQMGDPMVFMKKPAREQQAVYNRMNAITDKLTKAQEKLYGDPTVAQKMQDDFGCGTINLQLSDRGVTGSINCGRTLGSLTVSGARK
ncbi:MAG: hypothetical protein JNM38_08650 [Acidobacteria bacterium]|nr:hypothetical protein [Acidobacteriota bacterium]